MRIQALFSFVALIEPICPCIMHAEYSDDGITKLTQTNLPSWRAMHADTAPWAENLQLEFFRQAPAWRKLEMAGELTKGMLFLAESGLRSRHPKSSQAEIRRRLADVLLGPELAARVYGPLDDA